MTKRSISITYQVLALVVALVVISWAGTVFADNRPDLVVAVNKLPRGLEPTVQSGNVDVRVTYTIFDTLIRRDFTRKNRGQTYTLTKTLLLAYRPPNPSINRSTSLVVL